MTRPRVSFEWGIHYACNFRCPYCWFDGKWHEVAPNNRYLPVDELAAQWDRVHEKYGECHVHIDSGEPSTYPGFFELAARMSKKHFIGITSNMSAPLERWKFLAENVDPARFDIACSFHPQMSEYAPFAEKVSYLKGKGFEAMSVVYVAYPPNLAQMERCKERFASQGLIFQIQAFNGTYNGKSYPAAYSPDERRLMARMNGTLDEYYQTQLEYQINAKKPKGRLCRAGYIHAFVDQRGQVFRCTMDQQTVLGNLFDGTFLLYDEPRYCEVEHCQCEWFWLVDEAHLRKGTLENVGPAAEAGQGTTP
jgi:MoaA/NifB/PqqE/SkfB family radical SAM enzyme